MNLLLKISSLSLLLSASSPAAISLLIEPASSNFSKWTIAQTSPSPELNIAGLSGYAMGITLPQSMFSYTYLPGEGPYTPVDAPLSGILGNVDEVYGESSFRLETLHISYSSSSGVSYLPFSSLWIVGGQTSARFDLTAAGSVSPNIAFALFVPGTHVIQDTLFGTVTVTVVPEASSLLLSGIAALRLLYRRRAS